MDKKVASRVERIITLETRCAVNNKEYIKKLKEMGKATGPRPSLRNMIRSYKALGDPIRIRIIRLLQHQEMFVCEIMVSLGLTQPTTSHHLRLLETAGLINRRKEGKWVFHKIANQKMISALRDIHLI